MKRTMIRAPAPGAVRPRGRADRAGRTLAAAALVVACRKDPAVEDAGVPWEASAPLPMRDAGHDAGLDPACEGLELSLYGLATDDRCAADPRVFWAGVDAGTPEVRWLARLEKDEVIASLANPSSFAIDVPLRVHPSRPKLPAFSIVAESESHALYELESPRIADAPHVADAGSRVYSSRMRLLPGGTARVRLAVDPRVVQRPDRPCVDAGAPDAGPCAPARLPKGHYTLHVGALLVPFELPPAHVEWDAP